VGASRLALTPSGEIIVAGYFQEITLGENDYDSRWSDAFFIRLSSAGDLLWHDVTVIQPYESTAPSVRPAALAVTSDGGFAVGMRFENEVEIGGQMLNAANLRQDVAVLRYAANGSVKWVRQLGSINDNSDASISSILLDPDGNLVAAVSFGMKAMPQLISFVSPIAMARCCGSSTCTLKFRQWHSTQVTN